MIHALGIVYLALFGVSITSALIDRTHPVAKGVAILTGLCAITQGVTATIS